MSHVACLELLTTFPIQSFSRHSVPLELGTVRTEPKLRAFCLIQDKAVGVCWRSKARPRPRFDLSGNLAKFPLVTKPKARIECNLESWSWSSCFELEKPKFVSHRIAFWNHVQSDLWLNLKSQSLLTAKLVLSHNSKCRTSSQSSTMVMERSTIPEVLPLSEQQSRAWKCTRCRKVHPSIFKSWIPTTVYALPFPSITGSLMIYDTACRTWTGEFVPRLPKLENLKQHTSRLCFLCQNVCGVDLA